eukprot:IDg9869t1
MLDALEAVEHRIVTRPMGNDLHANALLCEFPAIMNGATNSLRISSPFTKNEARTASGESHTTEIPRGKFLGQSVKPSRNSMIVRLAPFAPANTTRSVLEPVACVGFVEVGLGESEGPGPSPCTIGHEADTYDKVGSGDGESEGAGPSPCTIGHEADT